MTDKLDVTEEKYRLHIFSFELGNSLRLGNMTYDSTSMQLFNVASRCTKISSTVYKCLSLKNRHALRQIHPVFYSETN